MNDVTTTDFSKFGHRERVIARKLLQAWEEQDLPDGFDDDGVNIMMNTNSGKVFLTNSEYQVAMLDGDTLRLFHSLPYGGAEGFLADLMAEHKPADLNADDVDYIRHAPEFEGLVEAGGNAALKPWKAAA